MIKIIFEEEIKLDVRWGKWIPHGKINDKGLLTYGAVNGELDQPAKDRALKETDELKKFYDAFILSGFSTPASMDKFIHNLFRPLHYYKITDFDNTMTDVDKAKIKEALMQQLNIHADMECKTVDEYLQSGTFNQLNTQFVEQSQRFTRNKIIKQNPELARGIGKNTGNKIAKRKEKIANMVKSAEDAAKKNDSVYNTVYKRAKHANSKSSKKDNKKTNKNNNKTSKKNNKSKGPEN